MGKASRGRDLGVGLKDESDAVHSAGQWAGHSGQREQRVWLGNWGTGVQVGKGRRSGRGVRQTALPRAPAGSAGDAPESPPLVPFHPWERI